MPDHHARREAALDSLLREREAIDLLGQLALPGADEVVGEHPVTHDPITMADVCREQSKLLGQVIARARRFARSANPRVKAEGNDLLRLLGQRD